MFHLTMPEEKMRKLNREQYYKAQSYLRLVARTMKANIDEEAIQKSFSDLVMYGHSAILIKGDKKCQQIKWEDVLIPLEKS
jgi:hypothetical protein